VFGIALVWLGMVFGWFGCGGGIVLALFSYLFDMSAVIVSGISRVLD